MPNNQCLEKLATETKSLLSSTRGIFSLIKAKDYDLFECLCSEKLDRAHPEQDMRRLIDQEFAHALEQKTEKNTPVHILDIGSGMLFSTAVRVAELVRRGFKDIHIYVIDPLYDDNLQKRMLSNIHPERASMADAAKKAFQEFSRLMQDCGINFLVGDIQGYTKKIVNELKMSKSDEKHDATVHAHIFGNIEQVPEETIKQINAVLVIDIFPPISLYSILGSAKHSLSDQALIYSCKERFFSRSEMIDSLTLDDVKRALQSIADEKTMIEIKECWDDIVNRFYPENALGNFDVFYAAVFNKTLPPNFRNVFEDTLKRISSRALETRVTQGSSLQYFDWDDAVDIHGNEMYHHLQHTDKSIKIYNVNRHQLWTINSSETSSKQEIRQEAGRRFITLKDI